MKIKIDADIAPIDDMILVLPDPMKVFSEGGIVIPEPQQYPTSTGVVIRSGRGIHTQMGELVKPNCQPGDRVLFSPMTGVDVEIFGVVHKMIRDHDIMGKLIKGKKK